MREMAGKDEASCDVRLSCCWLQGGGTKYWGIGDSLEYDGKDHCSAVVKMLMVKILAQREEESETWINVVILTTI